MLPVLQRAGHKLKVVTYGQSIEQLADYDLIRIRGIKHYYNAQGRFSLRRTVLQNLGVLAYYATSAERTPAPTGGILAGCFDRELRTLRAAGHPPAQNPGREFRQSACLALFSLPGASRLAAVGVDHEDRDRFTVRRADHYVIMALNPSVTEDPQVHVVPPVLQDEFRQLRPTIGTKVLVYLKHPNARFLEILKQNRSGIPGLWLQPGGHRRQPDLSGVQRPHAR